MGLDFSSPVTRRRIYRTIVAFVDDADFFSSGPNVIARLQYLITNYNRLYAATGGAGQLEKNNFYLWKTILTGDGELWFDDITATITVHNTKIAQLPIKTATKSLGVYYTPDSNWTRQFEEMKTKMRDSVKN